MRRISVSEAIGGGYGMLWYTNCHARYRIAKGGRATKKSTDLGYIEPIMKILDGGYRNILFIRQDDVNNAQSTYAGVRSKIYELGLQRLFSFTKNPRVITRKATGQIMAFRGLNDPESITSIKPVVGEFTDAYIEEASEIRSFEDFRKLDGSLRVNKYAPEGVGVQITLMMNAWDVSHWTYEAFFKGRMEDDVAELERKGYQFQEFPDFNIGFGYGLALHTSSYKINEFLTDEYRESMLRLKEAMYQKYLVEGLGCWGNTQDQTYETWDDSLIIDPRAAMDMRYAYYAIGIDTGLGDGEGRISKDPNQRVKSAMTMQLVALTADMEKVVCLEEYYFSNELSREKKGEPKVREEMIAAMKAWRDRWRGNPTVMKGRIPVYVDSASKGFRDNIEFEARRQGLTAPYFMPSTKLRIQTRVDLVRQMMAYGDFLVSRSCPNLIREIRNAKRGADGSCRADVDDHAINANEYGWASFYTFMKHWKGFKEH